MNLLVRVWGGFMIQVSLFYKDSSAKGGFTDLGTAAPPHTHTHKDVSQTFGSI